MSNTFNRLHASFYEYFRADLAALTRRGMEQSVRRGCPVGPAPLGYRNASAPSIGKMAIFDCQAPLVKKAFEMAADGKSLPAILKEVTNAGLRSRSGKPLSRTSLLHLLINPFYTGQLRYQGKLYQGNHTALVSPELFDRVQQKLPTRKV